jgi:hypothetical protein
MADDYLYVKKTHRNFDVSSKVYLPLCKYLKIMEGDHGLFYDPLAHFKIPIEYHCFRVVDKFKAFTFCMKHGEVTLKPDK